MWYAQNEPSSQTTYSFLHSTIISFSALNVTSVTVTIRIISQSISDLQSNVCFLVTTFPCKTSHISLCDRCKRQIGFQFICGIFLFYDLDKIGGNWNKVRLVSCTSVNMGLHDAFQMVLWKGEFDVPRYKCQSMSHSVGIRFRLINCSMMLINNIANLHIFGHFANR